MKILLQGGNYRESFNPQIYFGHIVEKGIPGHEIVTFGLHDRDQIKWRPEEPFERVMDRLPRGWSPDVYLCQGAEYHLLPRGIGNAPFPLVATAIDYDYHVTSSLRSARLFDLIVAYGEESRRDFERMGAHRVIAAPDWSGFLPEMFPEAPRPFDQREIDVSFAGNIDDLNNLDRSKILFRLSQLPESIRVRIQTYLSPKEYGRTLANSRLVFTYHRRGEIQSRLLDSMCNGAVGLCPYGREISKYFRDQNSENPEFLSYVDDRLEEEIVRFLREPMVGAKSARSGRRKALKSFDSRTALKRLFDAVEAELPTLRPSADRPGSDTWEVYYPIKSLYSDNAMADWLKWLELSVARLGERIASDPSPFLYNEMAVCLIALATADRNRKRGLARINRAIEVLKKCVERHPRYSIAVFNLAWTYVLVREDAAAEAAFRYGALSLESGEALLDPAANFDIEHNQLPHSFRRIYYDDMLEYIRTRSRGAFQRMKNVMASTCWYLAGQAARRLGQSDRALEYFDKAVRQDGRRGVVHLALADELHRQGKIAAAAGEAKEALERLPFDPKVVRKAAALSYEAGDHSGAQDILRQWEKASRRVDLLASYGEFFSQARADLSRLARRPLVSVIIPLYNYGNFVGECIQSVLNQTYENIEIIVVDHGSTDDGPEKAKAFGDRVRMLVCPRENSVHNTTAPLNMGIGESKGEFIAWLNADDLFLPEKIERQVDAAIMDESVDLVYSDYICEILAGVSPENLSYLRVNLSHEDWADLGRNGHIRGLAKASGFERHDLLYKMLEGNFVVASTTLIRKTALQALGGFDESLPQAQDYAMWLSIMASARRVVYLSEALGVFRIHEKNTRSWETLSNEMNRVRRAALQWPIDVFDPRLRMNGQREETARAHYRLVPPLLSNGMVPEALEQLRNALHFDPGNSRYERDRKGLEEILRHQGEKLRSGNPTVGFGVSEPDRAGQDSKGKSRAGGMRQRGRA